MMNDVEQTLKASKFAFTLYMIYMVSFFLHIPARLPILGLIRIDLLLVLIIFFQVSKIKVSAPAGSKAATYIKALFVCAIIALPFASWPGTVLSKGLPNLIKASIFFYFTYKLVLNEQRLKTMVTVFIVVNTIRVLEPLFLHFAFGYWGSQTSFGWDEVDRLAGAPSDVVNSNGLAFVIATLLPFYHYLLGGSKRFFHKIIYWGMLPVFLLTMQLTLSRTGILAVILIYTVIFFKSRRKFILLTIGTIGLIGFLASLNDVQRDRYLSIYSSDAKSSASSQGRVTGLERDLGVALQKPIFGHGLGTSLEANWNLGGNAQPAHNLWVETFEELGIVGLIIFMLYAKEIFKGFNLTNRVMNGADLSYFFKSCQPAMQTWLAMNFLFSFASYGLTSYEWYLFGGFSLAMSRIATQAAPKIGEN